MKTRTLIIIIAIEIPLLILLSFCIFYPVKNDAWGPSEGKEIDSLISFEERYSKVIENYDGKIKNVGAVPDEETAKQKALLLWNEMYKDETVLKNSVEVKYYEEQQCWLVYGRNNGRIVETQENDSVTNQNDIHSKTFHALIKTDGEVLAVY